MNTAVYKATKHDGNFPKQKHVIALCSFSWESKVTVKNMLDLLVERLHDSNWDVVFKSLIVVHSVMRDGCPDNVFGYLALSPSMLNVSTFKPKPGSSGMMQAKNIRAYAEYLENKVQIYQVRKVDFAESRSGRGMRLMNESVSGGLIENISLIQDHLEVLLKTKYPESDIDNHVILYSFKMLIRDILKIFQCVNQGIISVLKAYFDLGKDEASVCLALYRRFIKQTEQVIEYLDTARTLESLLQFTVPQLKHAPISLLESLEEHLKTPSNNPPPAALITTEAPSANSLNKPAKKKDAIDFFASLDDELAMQNYQPPMTNISIGSPNTAGNYLGNSLGGNPFAPVTQQRAASPFDSLNSLAIPTQQRTKSPFDTPTAYGQPFQPNFQNPHASLQPPAHSSFPASNQMSHMSMQPPSNFQNTSQLVPPNPFSQTAPNSFVPAHGSSISIGSNPFASTNGYGQNQPHSYGSLHQNPPQNRNTMNPFGANTFSGQHTQSPPNFGFGNFGTQTSAPSFQKPPQNGLQNSSLNDLSSLFSQHSFPTQ